MKPEMQRRLSWMLFLRGVGGLRLWPMLGLLAALILLAYFIEPRKFVAFETVRVIEFRTHHTIYGTKPYAVVETQDGRTLHMAGYPDHAQRAGVVCAKVSEGMLFGGTRVNIALKKDCAS